MNETNNHALVPRPSSAVEKAAPGAKRILSGMVADALALVKESPPKPILSVLLLADGTFDECWKLLVKFKFEHQYDLRFTYFTRASELLPVTQQQAFDLIYMYFRNVSWDVPGNEFDLLASLKYGKRIIVTQAMDLSELCERAGVGFLQCPWTLEQAYDAMELALKTPLNPPHALGKHAPQPHRTRPPRIVVVCENAGPLESISLVIERYVKDAAIVTFDDSEKAWQELSQTDPDLLITDYLMSRLNGKEILQRLLDRKAIYPIIVVSGFENTDLLLWVRECASRGLNVTFLNLPFDIESLVKALETALKIKIPRDAATRDEIKPIKSQAKTPKRRGTLLIVDDEDGVCQCLRVVFKDEYDLFTTDNGPTAIKLAQENDIDVVVTNIHMSGMSGIELLERLKFLSPDIEVIIMTGFETMDTVRESLRLGASDYINKPFDIETIRSAVSKAMQHHALESEKTAAWKNSSNKTGNVSEQPL